ncbi:multidrug transporter [Herbaspirillum rubrisubalbicans]|jgi:small multidrug resistance pump|uniref:Multidrug transporter n=2 Tax=Herbaspirillum rubrisubalbicans TaxID=80842 RepID=A0AAD0UGN1_9BURK|nr:MULTISPECIES: SMR family transporter [Herbaspirillum]ALU91710.1 cations and cationic drugs membrane transport protein [Herbaspirillum rubrisubalbicans M1]AYR26679.1 QacE family quaternary ammonium compound efflux SMR transporter [Herbaspirillum rubrisubalbicans]NQE49797.1 multidrug transporter [Herbaspirillum rubrisubalbicans]QJQ03625.1 QacE family quaternary ammonium compound efflux SMR transporter [Herbaspirillum rubrisubalbicans Os34]RAM63822.1 multidrug transporter [Herbaspirillum rubri
MSAYLTLSVAIVAEVIATTALKSSQGFTRLLPALIVVLGYGVSFYCLSLTLRTMPTSVAYAIWSGVGIVLVTLAAWLIHQQRLDWPAVAGIALIVAGVMVINVFSSSAGH